MHKINNLKRKKNIHRVASGLVMKKYRLKSTLEKATTLNRRKFLHGKSVVSEKKKRLAKVREQMNAEIVNFLERDDNSRMLPGKNDAVKSGAGKVQKRI